jgi:hypothetical protein
MTHRRKAINSQRTTRSTRRRRRGGYVLVLVALLLFGLMAMAALVIDLGFARLTQRQMQTAVDSAALEGLRGKVETEMPFAYSNRQTNASRILQFHFDDDLNPTNGDDGIDGSGGQFGAGPLAGFTNGAGDPSLFASQTMTVDPGNITYKPVPQNGKETFGEFRVRVQRGGTVDTDADIFAQGPAVPFLFGRGSLLNRQLIGRGFVMEAKSISVSQPALKIGVAVVGYPGAIPIGYGLADWNANKSAPFVLSTEATSVGQTVAVIGPAPNILDGYCSIFIDDPLSAINNVVVGFGWIDGIPRTGVNIAPGNAQSRLSEVWNDIPQSIRQDVLNPNRSIFDRLQVAMPERLVR